MNAACLYPASIWSEVSLAGWAYSVIWVHLKCWCVSPKLHISGHMLCNQSQYGAAYVHISTIIDSNCAMGAQKSNPSYPIT